MEYFFWQITKGSREGRSLSLMFAAKFFMRTVCAAAASRTASPAHARAWRWSWTPMSGLSRYSAGVCRRGIYNNLKTVVQCADGQLRRGVNSRSDSMPCRRVARLIKVLCKVILTSCIDIVYGAAPNIRFDYLVTISLKISRR